MYRLMFAVTGALFAGAMLQEPAPLPAAQTQAPGHAQIRELAAGDFATVVPAPWLDEDPADSLYRLARESLNLGRYREALNRFQELRRKYPDSGYTPDALYWEAFALYRLGTRDNLRAAVEKLAAQRERYPTAATRGDADALLARINAALARSGDERAALRMAQAAERAAVPPTPPSPVSAPLPVAAPAPPRGAPTFSNDCANEDEVQVMALHSLMQNDPDRALPILRKVLARRDAGSACLRRHALFVVASRQGADVADLLLSAARSDPDPEVRQSAVFWLARVQDPQAVTILDSVLRTATDKEVQQAAMFALGGRNDARSAALLKEYALRDDIDEEVRNAAIIHLLRSSGSRDPAFVRQLYEQAKNLETKQMVLMLGMHNGAAIDTDWLIAIASDRAEQAELRHAALIGLSRSDLSGAELMRILESLPADDSEAGGMMMMVMMQHAEDPAVIGKALELARSSKNQELRRAAVMLLSRSKDPRATQYLAELLEQ